MYLINQKKGNQENGKRMKKDRSTLRQMREKRIAKEKLKLADKKIEFIKKNEKAQIRKIKNLKIKEKTEMLMEKLLKSQFDERETVIQELEHLCFKNSKIYQSKRIQKYLKTEQNAENKSSSEGSNLNNEAEVQTVKDQDQNIQNGKRFKHNNF